MPLDSNDLHLTISEQRHDNQSLYISIIPPFNSMDLTKELIIEVSDLFSNRSNFSKPFNFEIGSSGASL